MASVLRMPMRWPKNLYISSHQSTACWLVSEREHWRKGRGGGMMNGILLQVNCLKSLRQIIEYKESTVKASSPRSSLRRPKYQAMPQRPPIPNQSRPYFEHQL